MEVEPSLIMASVYASDPEKDKFFVKINFVNSGMYINSFSVSPSKYTSEYWVQAPQHKQRFGWTTTVDFDKSKPLWNIIQSKCLEAVRAYKSESQYLDTKTKDVIVEDIDDELDFSKIPF